MIIPKLVGRLGNQLFQAATAIAYAIDNNQPYHIPPVTVNPMLWKSYLVKHQNKHFNVKLPRITIQESAHSYTPLPKFHKDWEGKNVILEGFFQTSKYFDHHRERILTLFNIPYKPIEDFVSIHVRRGDYVDLADKHPPVTYEYIKEAVMYFCKIGFNSFVVCSDDIKWCKETFAPLKIITTAEFTYSEKQREIEDLALLSCCSHQIISNSSFSWWGHYLNRNPGKICIAPKIWFGPGNSHLSTTDVYPENAIKL